MKNGSKLSDRDRILATVDSIPKGCVASYGQVAAEAGLPRRARLVGTVLGSLTGAGSLPWHRVVNARGELSVRGPARAEQIKRLKREGVRMNARERIDMAEFGWRPE